MAGSQGNAKDITRARGHAHMDTEVADLDKAPTTPETTAGNTARSTAGNTGAAEVAKPQKAPEQRHGSSEEHKSYIVRGP